ncbi:hypothetical protein H0H92_014510, partial [Tricholoma furcatifolium]
PSGQEDNEFAEETISLSEVQSTERVSKRPHKRARLEDFVDIKAEQSDDEDDEDEDEGMGGLEDNAFINDEDEDDEDEHLVNSHFVPGANHQQSTVLSEAAGKLSLLRLNDPDWQGVMDRARQRAWRKTEAPQKEIVPKLWTIQVMAGREETIATTLGTRAIFSDIWSTLIRSVIGRHAIPGYIVVEADTAEHVWGLCQGVT